MKEKDYESCRFLNEANNNNDLNGTKQVNSNKLINDFKINDKEHKDITLLMLEKLLNNKNKFKIDNHFDKTNSKKFLKEKEECLSEIVIEDDVTVNNNRLKLDTITKKEFDIIMPTSPNKFTFGQA